LASRRRGAADARAALPTFYARARRTLARRGLRPGDGETAREFAQRVEAAVPPCAEPLARLTTAYEQVRFGVRPLTTEEATIIERSVLELRSRVAPFSGHPRSAAAARPPLQEMGTRALEIARAVKLRPVEQIAETLGLAP